MKNVKFFVIFAVVCVLAGLLVKAGIENNRRFFAGARCETVASATSRFIGEKFDKWETVVLTSENHRIIVRTNEARSGEPRSLKPGNQIWISGGEYVRRQSCNIRPTSRIW